MHHDVRLRAAARAIFDAVYPTDDFTPVAFDQAERFETIHYRRAVEAAQACFLVVGDGEQLVLI
ncbi:MAG: hypothetical protein IE928_09605 [Gammaproteobacteria bacterium]|jgi:hypothetical protein|nr:hypothetical protein [Gammaproteobacteria bacterium]